MSLRQKAHMSFRSHLRCACLGFARHQIFVQIQKLYQASRDPAVGLRRFIQVFSIPTFSEAVKVTERGTTAPEDGAESETKSQINK